MSSALQGIAIFIAMQYGMSFIKGKPAQTTTSAGINTADIPEFQLRPDLDEGAVFNPIPQRIAPIWSPESELDVVVYVSPTFVHTPLEKVPDKCLVMNEKAFRMGDYKDVRSIDREIAIPREVQDNGTLYGHFYVGLAGSELDPYASNYDAGRAYHVSRPLTQYLPKKRVKKTKNLLGGSNVTQEVEEPEEQATARTASYYHPNFTISFVPDSGILPFTTIHPAVRQYVQVEPTGARDSTGQNGWYYPILFYNTFWYVSRFILT